jgi:DNA-binding transcriptional LysR family regulator
MAADPFSWDDLRLVLAVADGRGLATAAETLGLNGSTVFRRLGQLEDRLGLKLFERHRTGYVPTAPGAEMTALARRMDEDATALALRLAGRSATPSGEVRVTTNDVFLVSVLTPLFARFRAVHPGITLDVVLSNEALNLSRRDADVAIRATDSPPDTLVGRRLCKIAWAVYGLAGALVDGQENWITIGDGLAVGRNRALRLQAPPERVVYKVNSVLGLVEAVEGGIGIGALPCFLADCRPALVRLTQPDATLASSLWLLTHPDLRDAPRIRPFMDFMAAGIAAERDRLEGNLPSPA